MKIVAITGSVATGKTTAAKTLSKLLGAEVIDADKIVHEFLKPGGEIWRKVIGAFGRDILKSNSHIDRKKLGRYVFSNNSRRKKLEQIIHPAVKKNIKEKIKQFKKNKTKWIIIDIPLLFEAKMEQVADKIIVVARSEDAQIKTLQKQKGLSVEEARKRIKSQIPLSQKMKRAHFVVDNNGTLREMKNQVRKIYQCLKTQI